MMNSGPVGEQRHHLPDRHAGGEAIDEDVDAERRDEGPEFVQRAGWRVRRFLSPMRRISGSAKTWRSDIARTPCRSRPCRSRHTATGVGSSGLQDVAAGERQAGEQHQDGAAGRAPLREAEESWFIIDPFVTSFLRVTDGSTAAAAG